jgi:predicted negative regulator of RcsB-dependent stress response
LAREQFVSDIFQEVDEEVRREQLKKLWDRYGNFVVAAAIIVVAAIGAWRGYQWWEAKKAAETGAAFEAAVTLADGGKHSEAEAAFAKIVADGTSGYRHLARLREAAELAHVDRKAAIAAYEKIAGDGAVGPVLQDLAALRAAARAADRARSHLPSHRPRIAGARRMARRRCCCGQTLVRHDRDRRPDAGRYPLPRRDADGAHRRREQKLRATL